MIKKNQFVDYVGFKYKVLDVVGAYAYVRPAFGKHLKEKRGCIRKVPKNILNRLSKHTVR